MTQSYEVLKSYLRNFSYPAVLQYLANEDQEDAAMLVYDQRDHFQ